MTITGTGALTSDGVTSVNWMSTAIAGQAELSTWPTSCLPDTGWPSIVAVPLSETVHVTFGVLAGTRPYISRSKASTISGRRRDHHPSAVVTLPPSFSVSGSGRFGNGFALASS